MRVKDINPGFDWSHSSSLTNVNGTLFFSADDGTAGFELWALQVGPPPIPTVSEWGLVAMTLLLISAGTMVLGRPGAHARSSKESGLPEGELR